MMALVDWFAVPGCAALLFGTAIQFATSVGAHGDEEVRLAEAAAQTTKEYAPTRVHLLKRRRWVRQQLPLALVETELDQLGRIRAEAVGWSALLLGAWASTLGASAAAGWLDHNVWTEMAGGVATLFLAAAGFTTGIVVGTPRRTLGAK